MRRTLAVLGIVVVGLLLAGCDKSSYQCRNGACDVSVSGMPEVSFNSGGSSNGPGDDDDADPEATFKVVGYEQSAVQVESMGDAKTIQAGQSARVGRMTVQVVSVKGESAELKVQR